MKRWGWLLVGLVLLSACPTEETSEPTTRTTARTTTTVAKTVAGKTSAQVSSDDLSRALLALEDMPVGFTPQAGVGPGNPGTPEACGVVLKTAARVSAFAGFIKSKDVGPLVVEGLFAFQPGQGRAYMDEVQNASQCGTFTGPDPATGVQATSRYEPLSFPPLGDRTVTFRVTAVGGGTGGVVERVYVQRGDFVIKLNHLGQVGKSDVDTAVTRDLAQKALAKLDRA